MLYRFLLADIEDIKFAEACIDQPYRFGVADTREKEPEDAYRHAVSVWSGRYRGKEEEALISTCCIGLTWPIRRKRRRSTDIDQSVSVSLDRYRLRKLKGNPVFMF
ncbi:unnamed protein product [Cochlearia groenlandica]